MNCVDSRAHDDDINTNGSATMMTPSFSIHGDLNAKIVNTKEKARRANSGTGSRLTANYEKGRDDAFVVDAKQRSLKDKSSSSLRNVASTKTVYLIRHAESNENHRLNSLSRALKRVGKLSLPSKEDISASVELLDIRAQIDSDVSEKGREQIEQLSNQLRKDDFVRKYGIQLVAHSNLKRARQTSEGMLGCVTASTGSLENEFAETKKASTVSRVVELPCLAERTPLECLPINHDVFTRRIADFEIWLEDQPEERIAIVGHSNYFRGMLGLPWKFGNCDVWKLEYRTPESREDQYLNRIPVDDDTVQVIEKVYPYGFETIKSEDSLDKFFDDEEKKDECDTERTEDISLPRGWSGLKNMYRYKEK